MSFVHPDREQIDLSAVLHALSDPQRRGIVAELAASDVPRPCGSFAPSISKSTRTHHFRVLREAGLVEQWKEGTSKMSRLRRDDIDARFPGLLDSVLGKAPVA
ncbi:MAG: helix-turn-helix transcriptional regulator [Actinobacteria bacterium]|nr:helix-turn-helix transcriptional regulator [Actinomycetota bacterium]